MMSRNYSNREALRKRFPNASEAFLARNSEPVAARPHPSIQEPAQGKTLDRAASGKDSSGRCHRSRVKIRVTVRAIRPCDYDNYHIKELQDVLVRAGILEDDSWDLLQGEVVSEKVDTIEQEGTLIEIFEG